MPFIQKIRSLEMWGAAGETRVISGEHVKIVSVTESCPLQRKARVVEQ